jgi:hypothetical protein
VVGNVGTTQVFQAGESCGPGTSGQSGNPGQGRGRGQGR